MLLQTDDQISQVNRQLDERGAALQTVCSRHEKTISETKAKFDKELAERMSASNSGEEKGMVRQVMGVDHSRELSALRRQLVAESAKDRAAIMSTLDAYEISIDTTLKLWESPVQVLSRHALGETTRTELQRQLAGAGPAELASTADLAIATGDRTLAAAVLVTADRGGKRYASFDRAAFADAVVGDEVKAMRKRLVELRAKAQGMRHVNRTFERGVESHLDKIALGLAQRDLAPKPDTRQSIGRQMRGQL